MLVTARHTVEARDVHAIPMNGLHARTEGCEPRQWDRNTVFKVKNFMYIQRFARHCDNVAAERRYEGTTLGEGTRDAL
jgi:hypothetical protein